MKKIISPIFVVVSLFLICLLVTVKYVNFGTVPETPANDLGKHLATALNFRDAILDGQYLPRLQLAPKALPDLPTFQFYGSLSSLSAFPFLLVGLSPLTSLMLGVLILRWVASLFLYETAKLLGSSRPVAILASASYILTPYITSNLYGRVAVPEAIAHCVLGVFFYGFIRLYFHGDRAAFATLVISIVALSLAHPTFLLYSIIFAVLCSLAIKDFIFAKRLALAIVCGMFCCCFQWMPGLLYFRDFQLNFVSGSPYGVREFTSASGLFWFPRALNLAADSNTARLYLTPGILTLPALFLVYRIRSNPMAKGIAVGLIVALFLSFSPIDVWKYLPKALWAVQFPYRILAFVAIFTSLAISLSFRRAGRLTCGLLLCVLMLQSGHLILQRPYGGVLPGGVSEGEIKSNYSIEDYITKSNERSMMPAVSGDGWLINYSNRLYGPRYDFPSVVSLKGDLKRNNIFLLPENDLGWSYIKIVGNFSGPIDGRANRLWMVYNESPVSPISDVAMLPKGKFSETFKVPNDGKLMKLECGTEVSTKTEDLSYCPDLSITTIDEYPRNAFFVEGGHNGDALLEVDGRTIFGDKSVDVWIAKPETPDVAIGGKTSIGVGQFKVKLPLPKAQGEYVLVTSDFLVPALVSAENSDLRRLSLNISKMEVVSRGGFSVLDVKSADVREIYRRGYERRFSINGVDDVGLDMIRKNGVRVELPMAYSRFIQVKQSGVVIPSYATKLGLISIFTKDPTAIVIAKFKFSKISIIITGIGLLLFGLLISRKGWF